MIVVGWKAHSSANDSRAKKHTVFIWVGFAMPQDSTLTLPPKRMVWTSRGDNGAFT